MGNSNSGEINSRNMVRGFVQLWPLCNIGGRKVTMETWETWEHSAMNRCTWAVVDSSFAVESANDASTCIDNFDKQIKHLQQNLQEASAYMQLHSGDFTVRILQGSGTRDWHFVLLLGCWWCVSVVFRCWANLYLFDLKAHERAILCRLSLGSKEHMCPQKLNIPTALIIFPNSQKTQPVDTV